MKLTPEEQIEAARLRGAAEWARRAAHGFDERRRLAMNRGDALDAGWYQSLAKEQRRLAKQADSDRRDIFDRARHAQIRAENEAWKARRMAVAR